MITSAKKYTKKQNKTNKKSGQTGLPWWHSG